MSLYPLMVYTPTTPERPLPRTCVCFRCVKNQHEKVEEPQKEEVLLCLEGNVLPIRLNRLHGVQIFKMLKFRGKVRIMIGYWY